MKRLASYAIDIALACAVIFSVGYLVLNSNQIQDDLINTDRPYVTRITNLEGNSGGTGFLVKAPSGNVYVLTNGHVCGLSKNGGPVFLRTSNGDVFVKKVLAVYSNHDLCLVESPEGSSGLTVAKSVRDGENVSIIGHPLLQPYTQLRAQISGELDITVFVGLDVPCEGTGYEKIPLDPFLSFITGGGTYACIRTLNAFALNANVLPGNSGSPVVNKYGEVVAVVYAGGEGRGYAVPLQEVKDFLRRY